MTYFTGFIFLQWSEILLEFRVLCFRDLGERENTYNVYHVYQEYIVVKCLWSLLFTQNEGHASGETGTASETLHPPSVTVSHSF